MSEAAHGTPTTSAQAATARRLTVTVVIPAFNAGRFLREGLASVRAQTRQPDQVIVVDDASRDDTGDIARGFGFEVPAHTVNRGEGAARNTGIALARGDVIAFLDADDFWKPEHLETVVGLLERHPAANVAYTLAELRGDTIGTWWKTIQPNIPTDALGESILKVVPLMTASAVRRESAMAVGGFNTTMPSAADYDFYLRIARRGDLFVCSHDVTAIYRKYPGQSSKRIATQKRCQLLSLQACYADFRSSEVPERVAWFEGRMRDMLERNLHVYFYARQPIVMGTLLVHGRFVPVSKAIRVRSWLRLLLLPAYVVWWEFHDVLRGAGLRRSAP